MVDPESLSFSFVFKSTARDEVMEIAILDFPARRKTILVMKRLQSPLSREKNKFVSSSKTDDLPLD